MTRELETHQRTDGRPTYEAPHAMRLGDPHAGTGLCESIGSGDSGDCIQTGRSAGLFCTSNGMTAGTDCSYDGFTATGTCLVGHSAG